MAYGNYGAMVFKNGERQQDREDNIPYEESESDSGYYLAFARRKEGLNVHHATMGNGIVRFCAYKSYPCLYVNGEELVIDQFRTDGHDSNDWDFYSHVFQGEIEGYKFKAMKGNDSYEFVDLQLIEPDGTEWLGRSGYCFGSGHENEDWSPEESLCK